MGQKTQQNVFKLLDSKMNEDCTELTNLVAWIPLLLVSKPLWLIVQTAL